MKKLAFDRHIANLYEDLKLIAESRYGDNGQDALHDALLSIYRSKAYSRLHAALRPEKITGWLVQATVFAVKSRCRDESVYRQRYSLLTDYEMEAIQADVRGGSEFVEEYPIDLVHDVQVAIGTLSEQHQQLIHAHYYEGKVIREIAKDVGETVYRVFTELEIAKACLRTELEVYRK